MSADTEVDEGLHSRQIAVYGMETMKKLSSHRVLVSGINGLGAEVAKNVILANVKAVTLHDTIATSYTDLSSHFYLTEADVGQNRAEASAKRLQELNTTVAVDVCTTELTEELVMAHDTVVLLDTYTADRGLSEEKLIELNAFCRSQSPPIAFITADVPGVFGRCFCDFGPVFNVFDTDGEQPHTAIVAGITVEEKDGQQVLVVACVDEERLEFEDGHHISFSEVEGLTGLNEAPPMPVKLLSPYSFSVTIPQNVDVAAAYVRGGIVTQIKMPKALEFRSLAECLKQPTEFLESDFAKFGRSRLLHVAFRALHAYRQANASLPASGDEENAKLLMSLTKHTNSADMAAEAKMEDGELDEAAANVVEALSRTCRGVVNPMCALFGGLVGQEVIKAASGKFHPLHQWFYLDAIETLPSPLPTAQDCTPVNSRYDGQIMVYGSQIQALIANQTYFLVGSGALGCEFLKNFAMMGLGTGEGHVFVTDDDTIERSNLSRQFLFRNWHVGKGKSETAVEGVKAMNPSLNITAMEDRVSPNTENVFDDIFWGRLNGVCNALDNVKARRYVDERCVFFRKPLLESGTLGTKCNTQVVVPHLTENYGASVDPPEKQAPDCTLHNFPHTINHCLSWGRSEFTGNFESGPAELLTFLQKASIEDYVESLKAAGSVPHDVVEKLSIVSTSLQEQPRSFEDCVGWARRRFEDYFSHRIKQLTHNFPEDAKTSTGTPFWSPPKRFPTPLVFDPQDPVHMQFIVSASILRAQCFSLPIPSGAGSPQFYEPVLGAVMVEDFKPKAGVKIETDPTAQSRGGEAATDDDDIESRTADLVAQLSSLSVSLDKGKVAPEEFEKDDDTNHHMAFISATGNLRGRCYGIGEVPQYRAKVIAGRIIPAIATATAMATGFVCLELLKVMQSKPLEAYKNTFANLALPLFSMCEPVPPKKVVSRTVKNVPDPINHPEYEEEEDIIAYPEGHTVWDKMEMRDVKDMSLEALFARFKAEHNGIDVGSLVVQTSSGKGKIVYNTMMPSTKANLPLTVSEVITQHGGYDLSTFTYFMPTILFENEDGDNVETPDVVLWL